MDDKHSALYIYMNTCIIQFLNLQDAFASERRKAKMLNFSIAYGKTPVGLARDWKVCFALNKLCISN